MESGIVFVDKSAGMTSRKVDNLLQKKFAIKKAGHLGTLDPFATGLLIVALGKATKFLPFIEDGEKTYLASLKLGQKTDTGDLDGEVIEEEAIPELDFASIQKTLASFLGKRKQMPPMASAIKIDGQPLYRLFREGKEAKREPRDIEIFSIQAIYFQEGRLDFTCRVSAGTYIRTLGEEIAEALGTVGHLTALRRAGIGKWDLRYAKHIEDLTEEDVFDPTILLRGYKHVEISEGDIIKVKSGMAMDFKQSYGERIAITYMGNALAIYEESEQSGIYRCLRGLF